jgi:hypothetical protein
MRAHSGPALGVFATPRRQVFACPRAQRHSVGDRIDRENAQPVDVEMCP